MPRALPAAGIGIVELGKEMATAMLKGGGTGFDASTADLMARAGV